ncbi:hypothetical protein OS493_013071 [Desmophyllum pertusum]|uniref:Uncharacterized protein n=1 Tax=Desmophyllum pertusum TaxID=174260 RepID=A0A9W9YPV1_9CNID|nr:hypothetical protein OS493_013071 [Desmophyllum pertusum]
MEFANSQIEELKKKDEENADKIKKLEDQLLYQEVYSRRENMRFFKIPEETEGHKDMGEVIHKFIRDELNIDDPGSIEFQEPTGRAHKQTKTHTHTRKIGIKQREKEEAMAENEKKKEGKMAYFSKPEPDKLYIDGKLIPL